MIRTLAFLASAAALHAEIAAVAHPEEPLPAERTVVWTPLFQAGWDALNAERPGKRPVRIEPANALMAKLDAFRWDAAQVMPKDRWKVWTGPATGEFVKKANAEAVEWSGRPGAPFAEVPVDRPGGRLVLALLDRELVFRFSLHRSRETPLKFRLPGGKVAPVRFFGVRGAGSAAFSSQIRILARGPGFHAIGIPGKEAEQVVLYLPEKPEDFAAALVKLRGWRAEKRTAPGGAAEDPWLHEMDDVRIPLLTLESKVDFGARLEGARFFEGEPEPWKIVQAQQQVKFKLSEKGAEVRARVENGMDPFGDPPATVKPVPRQFLFDRPFFVFLWRDDAEWPYFGGWIGNADAMEEVK